MLAKLRALLGLRAHRLQAPAPDRLQSDQTDAAAHPTEVSDPTFDQLVLQSPQPVVVDFWADWCQPCHVMAPTIALLAEEYAGRALVAKLDVDANPEIPARYQIMGIPTIIFFQDGVEVERHVGIATLGQLSRRLDNLLKST